MAKKIKKNKKTSTIVMQNRFELQKLVNVGVRKLGTPQY